MFKLSSNLLKKTVCSLKQRLQFFGSVSGFFSFSAFFS